MSREDRRLWTENLYNNMQLTDEHRHELKQANIKINQETDQLIDDLQSREAMNRHD